MIRNERCDGGSTSKIEARLNERGSSQGSTCLLVGAVPGTPEEEVADLQDQKDCTPEQRPEIAESIALRILGEGLHPLQDLHAHTPDYVKKAGSVCYHLPSSCHGGGADDPYHISLSEHSPPSLNPEHRAQGLNQRYTVTEESTKFYLQCYLDNRKITPEELSSIILEEGKTCYTSASHPRL